MYFQYAGINFQISQVSDYEMVNVMTEDGANYLYTSTDVKFQCVLNPSATNAGQPTVASAVVALRSALANPRQSFTIWNNTANGVEIILQSPLPDMPTDFKFGPLVSVTRIDPTQGINSFMMDVEIHTDLGCESKPFLLANQWQFAVQHDPDSHIAIHVIDGIAHFRMDALIDNNVTPDQ